MMIYYRLMLLGRWGGGLMVMIDYGTIALMTFHFLKVPSLKIEPTKKHLFGGFLDALLCIRVGRFLMKKIIRIIVPPGKY
jgi:hypothetical protein